MVDYNKEVARVEAQAKALYDKTSVRNRNIAIATVVVLFLVGLVVIFA